jgi:hypothetical protein
MISFGLLAMEGIFLTLFQSMNGEECREIDEA